MRATSRLRAVGTLAIAALIGGAIAAPTAQADGSEVLGPPSIPIASGSGIASGGVGMMVQPATLTVAVPATATVKQVLLYWEGHTNQYAPWEGPDDTIRANGTTVITGTRIGGPTFFYSPMHAHAYRADITELNLVKPGANSIAFDGLEFAYANGASIVAIYQEPGEAADIQIRDGLDLAYRDFAAPLDTTSPLTYTFAASPAARSATLTLIAASVEANRPNLLDVKIDGVSQPYVQDPFYNSAGSQWDNITVPVTVPAGATSITVQVLSQALDGDTRQPASLSWITSALSLPTPPPPPPPAPRAATFLVIDEDGIDNGPRYWPTSDSSFTASNIKTWSMNDVNDDRPGLAQRLQLRWFAQNVGSTFWFQTGQVGDEGWFAPKVIPSSWGTAGPTADGLRNFLGNPTQPTKHNVGPGLGTGSDPEKRLDKIPHVIPLRAEGLWGLKGKTVCALVWDSDISINYDQGTPLGINGSLKGEKLGVVAFDVLDASYQSGFSSSTLPRVQVTIRDANQVCEGAQTLYSDAPEMKTSSVPADIRPNFAGDDTGYLYITR
jgi:hypothetical protein